MSLISWAYSSLCSVINTSFGECDIGEHFLSRISMDDLIKSFERVDIKIVLVNYHKFNKVILDTSGRRGRQYKTGTVFSNDPSAPSQMISIKADIQEE